MSELSPATETLVPLVCDEESRPISFVGRRVRISMGEIHKRIEAIDHAVRVGAHLELEINEPWSDVFSILASRWAGSVSAYMVVHQGCRHVLQRVRSLPAWLRGGLTLYFLSPERGGLSADERTLELLDLAQAFPQHQVELVSEGDFLLGSLEARLRDGVVVKLIEDLRKAPQPVFSCVIHGLSRFEQSTVRCLSAWWLRPLTYLMLLAVLVFYSLSSLLDRIFVGGLNLAQEAYVRARRSEHSRVRSGALAALAAAHGLKQHPIVGQAKTLRWQAEALRWQAEDVKWKVFDLKRHLWVHHAPVPWLKVYVPPAYGAIEVSRSAFWRAHRLYWWLFHQASESRGRARVLPSLIFWRIYHLVSESRGHSYRLIVIFYWSVYRVWGSIKCKWLSSIWILRHPWSFLETRIPCLKVIRDVVLKPYYFSKYQWEKRVLGLHIDSGVKS